VPAGERALGRFRLLHELGSGGMATLYLATDELGCLVAIKRLHAHLAADPRFVEMFVDEATIAAHVVHPNVCKVMGLERSAGHLFIAMEYVHGESLAALLLQVPDLPLDAALHLVSQACLGLHAAHEQLGEDGRPLAIVHRDVSPQNLLLSYEGELKVVDFGIASAAAKLHHTETGTIKGKLAYMAPEQTHGRVDRRADLFSLGVVLYEAVTGARCFAADSPAEILRRVSDADYVPPRQHRPDLPGPVEQVITRALAREPAKRYQTAEEMYRDLYACLVRSRAGMSARALGELMRRAFARRYAMREELVALAFAAPDVLEEEELTAELVPSALEAALRCEYCGAGQPSDAALAAHVASCGQRAWWERNFGGNRRLAGAGNADDLRRQSLIAVGSGELRRQGLAGASVPPPEGLWQRLRKRLRPEKRDPLLVRLDGISSRLQSVRDHAASRVAERGMATLWAMVEEVGTRTELLGRLKPRLLRCGNALLGVALEIDANSAFLAGVGDRELADQVTALERRLGAVSSPGVARELERAVRHKRALQAERGRLSARSDLLLVRLESMVDAIDLTRSRVLQIVSSPASAEVQADTQITVFLDSLLIEVEQLAQAAQEAESVMPL